MCLGLARWRTSATGRKQKLMFLGQLDRTRVANSEAHQVEAELRVLVLELLFDWIGYRTARFLLPLLTFGRATVEDLTSNRAGFNWFGARRSEDGAHLISATMAGWIGVLFWMIALIVAVAVIR